MEATIDNRLNLVEFFLNKRANLDKTDKNHRTALEYSRLFGHREIEKILLEAEQN